MQKVNWMHWASGLCQGHHWDDGQNFQNPGPGDWGSTSHSKGEAWTTARIFWKASSNFQALLDKDSQGYTAFNMEFRRFLFLRAPQGFSSSGDHFNSTTDQFFSGIGEWLVKQVDNMYILASSLGELESRLEIVAGEAKKQGCTWSITKFFTDRETNIVSAKFF